MAWHDDPRHLLTSLSVADHKGDINDVLPHLARLLGLDPGEFCEDCESWTFPWDDHDCGEE